MGSKTDSLWNCGHGNQLSGPSRSAANYRWSPTCLITTARSVLMSMRIWVISSKRPSIASRRVGVVSRLPLSGLPGIGSSPPLSTASRCSGFPTQCYRQRFQGSRAAAALNGVALNFPHDRGRYMRSFRKFALTPSKLSHPLIDGLSDGRPILRHPIPPRSALAPRLADRRHSAAPPRAPSPCESAQAMTWCAEIIDGSLKSAQGHVRRGYVPAPAKGRLMSPVILTLVIAAITGLGFLAMIAILLIAMRTEGPYLSPT